MQQPSTVQYKTRSYMNTSPQANANPRLYHTVHGRSARYWGMFLWVAHVFLEAFKACTQPMRTQARWAWLNLVYQRLMFESTCINQCCYTCMTSVCVMSDIRVTSHEQLYRTGLSNIPKNLYLSTKKRIKSSTDLEIMSPPPPSMLSLHHFLLCFYILCFRFLILHRWVQLSSEYPCSK